MLVARLGPNCKKVIPLKMTTHTQIFISNKLFYFEITYCFQNIFSVQLFAIQIFFHYLEWLSGQRIMSNYISNIILNNVIQMEP